MERRTIWGVGDHLTPCISFTTPLAVLGSWQTLIGRLPQCPEVPEVLRLSSSNNVLASSPEVGSRNFDKANVLMLSILVRR